MENPIKQYQELPGRILLDTCILNLLQDEGEYIFEGQLPQEITEAQVDAQLKALRSIFVVNERASLQFVVSPVTFAELANQTDMLAGWRRIRWALDVLDAWLIMLEDTQDRVARGGKVRHRFKLSGELQELEARLLTISDFRRDPLDRLLMLQYKMGNCDAFLTIDLNTIWRHRDWLRKEGIMVLQPAEFWEILMPLAALWR
jgi:hypothetical protein